MSDPKKTRRRKRIQKRRSFPFSDTNWRRVFVGTATVAFCATAAVTTVLWTNGWIPEQITRAQENLYGMTADAGLKVQDVLVEGRNRTKAAAILTKLDVERGTPILAFSPEEAKLKIEALPWVKQAVVERRLPNVIYVNLIEREPLALWQQDGVLHVIDQEGDVIESSKASNFAKLPLIVGSDAPSYAREILALLESEPELGGQVEAAVRVSGRRWNIRLNNGVDVQLPEENPEAAWSFFARIEREEGVLERDVVLVDLRLRDRLIVRTSSGAAKDKGQVVKGEKT
ncbi:FtsQ-type POTRA domain-containing protein [Kiloniella laminariae]|uniref:Cell division protein FtsQ n=1 Tax=Kiloniella laminariae TaxID=454162 RepID=A0ABT4LDW7_9PROT|nr:cell division protein FtsQ/DivIB [Kiloniella laminariae]MCZ4279289.1 FtsQ-type POTRA domain-containing protein [Kiloniella laminariae]